MTSGTSSHPPASSRSTLTSGFSASRRATTEPDEPDPQTMKSYCNLRSDLSFCWLARTRSMKSAVCVPPVSSATVPASFLMMFVLIYLRDDLPLGFESAQYHVPCAAMLSRHNGVG